MVNSGIVRPEEERDFVALRMASETFALPEIFYFPPFFTLQPVDSTRAKQLEQWRALIVGWHQANKTTSLVVKDWPLWANKEINRRLPDEAISTVLEYVVSSGSGEWEDPASKTRLRVFYRSPSDWGKAIHRYACDHGMAMEGSIYTLYEIRTAGEWQGNEFCSLEPAMLLRALESLAKEGLADLVRDEGVTALDEIGVKFREHR